MYSFSNLFSPSNKSAAKQQNVPDVRYSALQGTDTGNIDEASQSNSAAERSSRTVRFRDEDMYLHFKFFFRSFPVFFYCT